ncbi:hypothetical protein CEXT_491381 [Caerostris extrusa]|uniref:Uncharacterized protein n=1 Tax=Caerostris extrusa TaxID=172846 RepID=A0AAV4SX34_CAEEX|nr:hypothetical protein CEXT_491381 [Caerostris extrusa]
MKNNFQVFSEQSHLNRGTVERLVCYVHSVSPEDLQRELSVPIGYKGGGIQSIHPLAETYAPRFLQLSAGFVEKAVCSRSVGIPRIRPASIQVAKLYADAAGIPGSQFARLGKFRRSSGLLLFESVCSLRIDGCGIRKQNV